MDIKYEKLYETIKNNLEDVFALSQWLTAHPEVGGQEKESSRHIIGYLQNNGYKIERDYCGLKYAFRAYKESSKPRIAVMCEYDALPEIGHGCGHSLSCAISILAARSVMETFKEFPFEIDLIGTPAEETIGGKAVLAKSGGFDNYEYAIMGHIDSINATQIKVLASNDMYITFHGKAAHASTAPWKGKSALNAAQLFMHGMDLQRVSYKPFMQMHGIVVKGGTTPGTLPDEVILDYYPRAASMSELAELRENALQMLKGVAIATGTTYTAEQRYDTFAELHYGETARKTLTDIFEGIGEKVEEMKYPEGSTDAGNVDLVIPTFHLEIKGTDNYVNFHTVEFEKLMYGDRARKTLYNGSRVIGNFIARTAYKEGLLDKLKQEHKAYRDSQKCR